MKNGEYVTNRSFRAEVIDISFEAISGEYTAVFIKILDPEGFPRDIDALGAWRIEYSDGSKLAFTLKSWHRESGLVELVGRLVPQAVVDEIQVPEFATVEEAEAWLAEQAARLQPGPVVR